MDSDNYPETCHNIFIVNNSSAFSAIWRVVKVFVDVGTREKIKVLGSGNPMLVSRRCHPFWVAGGGAFRALLLEPGCLNPESQCSRWGMCWYAGAWGRLWNLCWGFDAFDMELPGVQATLCLLLEAWVQGRIDYGATHPEPTATTCYTRASNVPPLSALRASRPCCKSLMRLRSHHSLGVHWITTSGGGSGWR